VRPASARVDDFFDETPRSTPRGALVLAPGGLTHEFENRSPERAGVLNFSVPVRFEAERPAVADWLLRRPPGDTR
jgi:hypothetical protein